jgi:signal transduction histidine kinase/CheY-like chemotaxis protein
MTHPILTLELRSEHDVVLARQRARHVAALLGFDTQKQTRITTAVSEIARNAVQYGGGGRVEFLVDLEVSSLFVRITDRGPGIPDLESILLGRYQSKTGMGLGILGARRLMTTFDAKSSPEEGTCILLGKKLPAPIASSQLAGIAEQIAKQRPGDVFGEIQEQNQELLRMLEELQRQREELSHVNRELEETNRGVVALYAELDGRAQLLQQASEVKTRFLSNMTHEFRTPLASIISLARILEQKIDGDLTAEQEKQVRFIMRAAESLSELVNDLLDIAKVESGKVQVRPAVFVVDELFGALRGMLRPLLANRSGLELIFQLEPGLPSLRTDESKLSQILRNLISNAIKFTERGEVRVSARRHGFDQILFEVEDTGPGIREEDQERIFEEFTQLDHPAHGRRPGTGLGLPLARKLAGVLGGSVTVQSALERGSKFSVAIPIHVTGPMHRPLFTEVRPQPENSEASGEDRMSQKVLIIDDDEASRYSLRGLLGERISVLEAEGGLAGIQLAAAERPGMIFLDLVMPGMNGIEVLHALKADARTRDIPIVIYTGKQLLDADLEELAKASGILAKEAPSQDAAAAAVREHLVRAGFRFENNAGEAHA